MRKNKKREKENNKNKKINNKDIVILEDDNILIRCMGCARSMPIKDLVKNQWIACSHCNFVICPECYEALEEPKKCFSPICNGENILEPQEPPIEEYIKFAKELPSLYEEGIIYNLFFKEREQKLTNIFPEISEKNVNINKETYQTREEIWKNIGVVITKRRKGKFITWEKIY